MQQISTAKPLCEFDPDRQAQVQSRDAVLRHLSVPVCSSVIDMQDAIALSCFLNYSYFLLMCVLPLVGFVLKSSTSASVSLQKSSAT